MANSRVVLGGLVALSCLLIAACDRGAGTSGPSCDTAAAQIVASVSGGDKSVSTMEAKGAVVKTCTDTKWPEPARTCLAKAQSSDDYAKCKHDTLTGAQADKLDGATANISSTSMKAAMKKMHEFSDKMCQCKDASCAQKVADEMTQWSQEMAKHQKEPPKMSEAEIKEATELGQRMGECMQKAMGAGDPAALNPEDSDPDPRELKEGDKTPDGRVISK